MAQPEFESNCLGSGSPEADAEMRFRCKLLIKQTVPGEIRKKVGGSKMYRFSIATEKVPQNLVA